MPVTAAATVSLSVSSFGTKGASDISGTPKWTLIHANPRNIPGSCQETVINLSALLQQVCRNILATGNTFKCAQVASFNMNFAHPRRHMRSHANRMISSVTSREHEQTCTLPPDHSHSNLILNCASKPDISGYVRDMFTHHFGCYGVDKSPDTGHRFGTTCQSFWGMIYLEDGR